MAQASQTEICGKKGSGYCLNDWNGRVTNGSPVNLYYGGSSNEGFYAVLVTSWCNNGHVDSNCAFSHTNFDQMYSGDNIEIAYNPRYWTDQNDAIAHLRSGGNPGVQAYYSGTPTCWGAG